MYYLKYNYQELVFIDKRNDLFGANIISHRIDNFENVINEIYPVKRNYVNGYCDKLLTVSVSTCLVEKLYLEEFSESLHYVSYYSNQPAQLSVDEAYGYLSWTDKRLLEDEIVNAVTPPIEYTYGVYKL